jgi:hypothetical protein
MLLRIACFILQNMIPDRRLFPVRMSSIQLALHFLTSILCVCSDGLVDDLLEFSFGKLGNRLLPTTKSLLN